MTQPLTGKVKLVNGGSRGLGAAIAKRLAADGADVALTYSASPDKADKVGREFSIFPGPGAASDPRPPRDVAPQGWSPSPGLRLSSANGRGSSRI
jgi:NAD(P)-dependent dehydrogenase (short-subunit alcohol dehydrogenase family)